MTGSHRRIKLVHFTSEDYRKLEQAIETLRERVSSIKRSIGESCQQGADTFHDNFDFEEAQRQLPLWEGRLRHLIRVRNATIIIEPDSSDKRAGIGKVVRIYDELIQEEISFQVGSFLVLENSEYVISLQSPLARAVRHAKKGDVRVCEVNGIQRVLRILEVS
ncbi:MAG: GreA/GreB family elongation factor [bacterium]|nr:GreA/GreB family elongation factor [bacterium]